MHLPHFLDRASLSLKRFILDRELEELTGDGLTIRVREPRKETEVNRGKGYRRSVDRWKMPVDFRWPASADGRPTSPNGGTSFHSKITPVSKARGEAAGTSNRAAQFDRYVGDTKVIPEIGSAEFDGYMAGVKTGVSAHDPAVERGTRVFVLRSNISLDSAERTAFWDDRYAEANTPGDDILEFVPGRGSTEAWRKLAIDKDTPGRVREHVLDLIAKATMAGSEQSGTELLAPSEIILKTAAEIAWAAALRDTYGKRKSDRMVHYRQPRGGRIQERIDAEIPAELGEEDVVKLVNKITAGLRRLRLKFTLAVHRPDALNDPRNWHIHIAYYPSFGVMIGDGLRSYAKAEGARKLRPGDIAKRIKGLVDVGVGYNHTMLAADDMAVLRATFALIIDRALEAAGHERRLDPRGHADMGVDQEPAEHLGSAMAQLVFAGHSTPISRANATKSWTGAERRAAAAITDDINRIIAPITASHVTASPDRATDGAMSDIGRRRKQILADAETLRADSLALMRFDLRQAIARSGAMLVERNADRVLAAIEAGTAANVDRQNVDAVRMRRALAGHHLREIDDAIEPWESGIATYREDLEQRREALAVATRTLADDAEKIIAARAAQVAAVGAKIVMPDVPLPTFTAVIDRIGNDQLHVDIRIEGGRKIYDAKGLSAEEAAVLNDPRHSGRRSAALVDFATNQRHAVNRVLTAIRTHGLAATRAATRSGSTELRADAKLLQKYDSHPHFCRGVEEAEAFWKALPRNAGKTDTNGSDLAGVTGQEGSAGPNIDALQAIREIANPVLADIHRGSPIAASGGLGADLPAGANAHQTMPIAALADKVGQPGDVEPKAAKAEPRQPPTSPFNAAKDDADLIRRSDEIQAMAEAWDAKRRQAQGRPTTSIVSPVTVSPATTGPASESPAKTLSAMVLHTPISTAGTAVHRFREAFDRTDDQHTAPGTSAPKRSELAPTEAKSVKGDDWHLDSRGAILNGPVRDETGVPSGSPEPDGAGSQARSTDDVSSIVGADDSETLGSPLQAASKVIIETIVDEVELMPTGSSMDRGIDRQAPTVSVEAVAELTRYDHPTDPDKAQPKGGVDDTETVTLDEIAAAMAVLDDRPRASDEMQSGLSKSNVDRAETAIVSDDQTAPDSRPIPLPEEARSDAVSAPGLASPSIPVEGASSATRTRKPVDVGTDSRPIATTQPCVPDPEQVDRASVVDVARDAFHGPDRLEFPGELGPRAPENTMVTPNPRSALPMPIAPSGQATDNRHSDPVDDDGRHQARPTVGSTERPALHDEAVRDRHYRAPIKQGVPAPSAAESGKVTRLAATDQRIGQGPRPDEPISLNLRSTPSSTPAAPFRLDAEALKEQRKKAVNRIVHQICRSGDGEGAGEHIRAPLRSLVRDLGKGLSEGWMSMRLEETNVIVASAMVEPGTWAEDIAKLKGGYAALRLLAEAVDDFGTDRAHTVQIRIGKGGDVAGSASVPHKPKGSVIE